MGFASAGVDPPFIAYKWAGDYGDKVAVAGTWAQYAGAALWIYNAYANQATKALNDELALTGFLVPKAAPYTLHLIYMESTDHGIIHIFINGVDVAQIDTYAGAADSNIVGSVSLGTLTAGLKIIRLKMASKNASSTAYKAAIQYLSIIKD